jgi:hypothetical protein
VVKINQKNKSAINKKSITLLQRLSIFSILMINLYLFYSVVSTVLPLISETDKPQQIDSIKTNIQVEVLNGCGISGIADKLKDFLRENSIDVVNIGNYRSFDIEKSIIVDRTGSKNNAKLIAEVLGLDDKNVVQLINREYLLDVTIILGKDYLQLIPLRKRS